MSKKNKIDRETEIMETNPSVNLIALHSGEVVYQAKVGGSALATVLLEIAAIPDFPIEKQEYQVDNIGQEILQTSDRELVLTLRSAFVSILWDRIKQLPTIFNSEGLTFSFVISY